MDGVIILRGNYPGVIVPGSSFPGLFSGGDCPGVNCPGTGFFFFFFTPYCSILPNRIN